MLAVSRAAARPITRRRRIAAAREAASPPRDYQAPGSGRRGRRRSCALVTNRESSPLALQIVGGRGAVGGGEVAVLGAAEVTGGAVEHPARRLPCGGVGGVGSDRGLQRLEVGAQRAQGGQHIVDARLG